MSLHEKKNSFDNNSLQVFFFSYKFLLCCNYMRSSLFTWLFPLLVVKLKWFQFF